MDKKLSDALVRFENATKKHFAAIQVGNASLANRQARSIDKAYTRIQQYGVEGLSGLLGLLSHEDEAVAGMAAAYTLSHAPDRVVPVVERIAAGTGFNAFRAGHMLRQWKEGTWRSGERTPDSVDNQHVHK